MNALEEQTFRNMELERLRLRAKDLESVNSELRWTNTLLKVDIEKLKDQLEKTRDEVAYLRYRIMEDSQ